MTGGEGAEFPVTSAENRPTAGVEAFYGRWAGVYDRIARRFPRIAAVRAAVADACRLGPGDTVVEMGCGTGANVPFLRDAVAPGGRVVGVDVTDPALRRAREQTPAGEDGVTVEFVRADGARPPVDAGDADAVVGTFVSGMFADAADVVDGWCDLAGGGHVVLADAAPSRHAAGRPVNALFRAATVVSTPPTRRLRYDRDLLAGLERRVDAAHGQVRRRATATAAREFLVGFVRLTGGRIPAGTEEV